jgi:tape measure domain-containing protein
MRGAKQEAEGLNTSLGQVGTHAGSSGGIGGLVVGMAALQMAMQKSEPLITRMFHAFETGVGRTARVLRVGGGITQYGAMFARQLPGMARFRADLAATEARAARFNSRLETLASMGGKSSGGFGMRFVGGPQPAMPVGGISPRAGVVGGAAGIGLMGMLKASALGLGAAGVMAGMQASNKAADYESSQISFKNLIGEAAKAKATLKDLFDFSANTPLEMPEVQASAVKLMAAGVAADNLVGSIETLGNVSSAYQANLLTTSTIFAQVVNKGQLYAEEIQQFGENGIPALRLLADEAGKSTAEIMAMATAGELTAADLARAFDKAGGAGGKFSQALAEQGESTKGLWSTFRDTVNQTLTKLGTPVNDWLKPWLKEAINTTSRFGEALVVAIDVGKQAVAQGRLGELLSASLKIGLAETLIFAGEVIGKMAAGLAEAMNFITIGDIDKGAAGFVDVFIGLGDIIRAELGTAFNDVITGFQAGLAVALGIVMEGIGKIPVLGEALGLSGFKGPDIDQAMEEMTALKTDMNTLREQGKARIRLAFGNPAEEIKKAVGEIAPADLEKLQQLLSGTVKDGVEDGGKKATLAQSIGDTTGAGKKKKEDKDKEEDQAEALRQENMGLEILRAKAAGKSKLMAALDRELKIRTETLRIMKATGISEREALEKAKERVSLLEKIDKKSARGDGDRERSKIIGFKREDTGLKKFGGLDEYKGLQDLKRRGVQPGERFDQRYGGLPGDKDLKTPATADTKPKQKRGFGGLDEFKGLQDLRTKGIAPGERFKRPAGPTGLQSPGAAKKEQERREAAAEAQKDRPRWDLVQTIEKHLAGLAVG